MVSCLDSPLRRLIFITSKQIFFKKADPFLPPSPYSLSPATLTCAQDLLVERTFVNGLSKGHNLKKKSLFTRKFAFLILVF